MAIHTSKLLQVNLKPSNANQNNPGSGMSARRILPNVLLNAGVPFLINILARPYMSTIDALLLASSVPALYTVGSLLVKRRIDVLGLLVVADLVLSAIFALLFNSPRLLLLQSAAVNGLFGVVMLLSLLFTRPILFYLVRSIMPQNDGQGIASFNADWAFPQIRSFYRVLTLVWGCVTLGQLMLVTGLSFTLPISLMVGIGPILNIAILLPAADWSVLYYRKNKRFFDQLRALRDATAAPAAR
jgi:hypothetical protein